MTPRDQLALNRSLKDAQQIARRLSLSIVTIRGHRAALDLILVLKRLGAKDDQ